MDADGKNVRRLTNDVGYDGGAFFNADCTKIVWRASRPKPGTELDDYQRLLAQNLVRPSKLELYVANADGSDAHAGHLPRRGVVRPVVACPAGSASSSRRTTAIRAGASSTSGRSTSTARASSASRPRPASTASRCSRPTASGWRSRRTARRRAGTHDTNVFVADWQPDAASPPAASSSRRRSRRWPTSAGSPIPRARAAASAPPGLEAAGAYLEERFRALGLEPAGDGGGYRQPFPVRTGPHGRAGDRAVASAARRSPRDAFVPLGLLGQRARPQAPLVLAGYGMRRQGAAASTTTRSSTCAARSSSCAASCPDHAALADARAPAARRRPAPQGLGRARARRARAAGRRPAGAPDGRAGRLEGARRGAAAARRAPRATATPASRCWWSSARRWRR